MQISDFQISNHDKLDAILVRLCEMVIQGQGKKGNLGMVAAAVLDPDNNCVVGINYPTQNGRRVHGERAAIDSYTARFGDIPAGSIIITTCSPCSHDMSERAGVNCSDLIDEVGVHKVYAGYQDPTQEFGDKKYHIEITGNPKIHELCERFAATFLKDELDESASEHVRMVMNSAADQMKQHGFRAVGQLSEKDLEQIAQQAGATLHDVCIILNIDHVDEKLNELNFLGSPCTKDCSGHRAGYAWSKQRGGADGNSPFSPSFNNGARLAKDGK